MPRSTLPAVNSGLSPSRLKSRLPLSVLASLLVLGAVFGVLQVALGVEMLLDGLRIAGVIG